MAASDLCCTLPMLDLTMLCMEEFAGRAVLFITQDKAIFFVPCLLCLKIYFVSLEMKRI